VAPPQVPYPIFILQNPSSFLCVLNHQKAIISWSKPLPPQRSAVTNSGHGGVTNQEKTKYMIDKKEVNLRL